MQPGETELFKPEAPPAPPIGARAEPGPPDLFVAPEVPALPGPPVRAELRGAPARWEIAGGLSGSVFSIHTGAADNGSVDQHGNRGSAYVGPTVFLTPVVDNDAPLSLQPYLQRTSAIYGGISGGGFVTRYGGGAFTRKDSSVGANVGADIYVTRHVALTGGFQYAYDVLHDESIEDKGHALSGNGGVGMRLGDTRIDASYSFSAYNLDGAFVKPRWGSVALDAYFLIAQSFSVELSGHAAEEGGGGAVNLALFAKKDLAFFGGLAGQTFVYTASGTRSSVYGGSLGLSYWVAPTLRFTWAYGLGLNNAPAQPLQAYETHQTTHSLSASFVARLP